MNIFKNRKRVNQIMYVLAVVMIIAMVMFTVATLIFK
jgi:hypothetical protein